MKSGNPDAIQAAILRALLFKPSTDLAHIQQDSNLPKATIDDHLQRLIAQGIIDQREKGIYELTPTGKEFANRLDTDTLLVERQPKLSVLLIVERSDGKLLAQQRLKQPFYGYWGRMSGKVQWGETFHEAAARELIEETGLTADHTFRVIYHKIDLVRNSDELLEDKIFLVFHSVHPRGKLIADFNGGHNEWLSAAELSGKSKVFEGVDTITETARLPGIQFLEQRFYHDRKDY